MKKRYLVILSIAMVFLTVIMPRSWAADKIIMEGSTTVAPIARECADEFMKTHSEVVITVKEGGSGAGVECLLGRSCHIAMCSRPFKDSEYEKAVTADVNPKAYVIALDAIAIIVHPSNPVSGLSQQEVKDIFSGKTKQWKDAGSSRIMLVVRDKNSGTNEIFNKIVMEQQPVHGDALVCSSSEDMVESVSRNKGAIGYVGLGWLSGKVKPVAINGIMPSKTNVLTGSYLISRPLFLYTDGQPKDLLKEFIDFVQSKKGKDIIERCGYVSLRN